MKSDRTKTGVVFNIQKYSVNDGPGIRTTVFFKGCPLRCRWCANPESQNVQMEIFHDNKKCRQCLHCLEVCPSSAITLRDERIHIDMHKCTHCLSCIHECPERALEAQGEVKTVEEVMKTVLEDKVFYEEGGGMTLSGGEMMAQPDFALQLLFAAKEEGIHTCVETTGYVTKEIFHTLLPHIDYVLFDLKHWDKEKHKWGTGVTNEVILENMKTAADMGKEILPRIPVIPGFNNSLEDAKQFSNLLHSLSIKRCQLLPFHQFGENKYHLLNRAYDYEDVPSLHKEDLEQYCSVFHQCGIHAFF